MDQKLKSELIELLEKTMKHGGSSDSSGEPKAQVVNNYFYLFSSDIGNLTAFKLLLQAHLKSTEPDAAPAAVKSKIVS